MPDIEEKEDIKVTSIRLSSDSYFALKRLCNRYHQITGEFITMSEFIENKLLKPHIEADKESSLI